MREKLEPLTDLAGKDVRLNELPMEIEAVDNFLTLLLIPNHQKRWSRS